MTVRAIDVHGFGGGFTLAAVQAGFELVGKKSRSLGFGVYNCLANRPLLGDKWEAQSEDPARWEPLEAELVFGNPPCSGFSTLSRKDFRGENSTINECMWELVRYAALVAPEVVAWESVQQTFRQGLGLMRRLHAYLVETTDHVYDLTHVLHNNLTHGGASDRRRYFWVAHRVPFGVESCVTWFDSRRQQLHVEPLTELPTFGDVLRDLKPLKATMEWQPYSATTPCACELNYQQGTDDLDDIDLEVDRRRHGCWREVVRSTSSRWAELQAHDGTGGVDGHQWMRSPGNQRVMEAARNLAADGFEWPVMGNAATILREHWRRYGRLPRGFDYFTRVVDERGRIPKWQRLVETDFALGHNQLTRWPATRPAYVLTGGAVHLVLHPDLLRTLTQREAARTQGFPDAWRIWPVRHAPDLGPGWGKGVPVQAGRWISHWIKESIEGRPGGTTGVPFVDYDNRLTRRYGAYDGVSGTRERVIDTTHDWKSFKLVDNPAAVG